MRCRLKVQMQEKMVETEIEMMVVVEEDKAAGRERDSSGLRN